MKLRTRFTLIGIGITIFIILAPILVFYARGFKYDFATRQIVKTGTLVLRTEPTKANIFLNSDTKPTTTPASIRFLTPGDYTIRLEKTGYQTWQKRLRVISQFVTWGNLNRDNIFLFSEKPNLLNTYNSQAVSVSADQTEIVYTHEGVEYLLRSANGHQETLGQTNSIQLPLPKHARIDWTEASQIWQLVQTTSAWPISQSQVEAIDNLYTNGRHTAVLTDGKLYSFEITRMELIADNTTAAFVEADRLWYISEGKLQLFDFNTKSSTLIAEGLPQTSGSQIIRGTDQVYVLNGQELYQITDTLKKLYSPVTFARWHENANKLVYGNGNEVYLYDPISAKSELALRSLTPILNVSLNWTTGYVFYVNDGKLKAAELDTRNGQNQFEILDFTNTQSFVLSQDGTKVFMINEDQIEEYQIR